MVTTNKNAKAAKINAKLFRRIIDDDISDFTLSVKNLYFLKPTNTTMPSNIMINKKKVIKSSVYLRSNKINIIEKDKPAFSRQKSVNKIGVLSSFFCLLYFAIIRVTKNPQQIDNIADR